MSDLEALLAAWPAPVEEQVGGWLARSGGGFTGRANTARPTREGVAPDLAAIRAWYAARGLAPRLLLPGGVPAPPGWRVDGGALLLGGPLRPLALEAVVELRSVPDATWIRRWLAFADRGVAHAAVAAQILVGVPQPRAFAAAGDVGVALGVVVRDALVLECVATAPAARRRGVAGAVCDALEAWGAGAGATRVVLAVDRANDAAQAFYARRGLRPVGQYAYASPLPA